MTTYQQIPGELNLEVGLGDDLSKLIDFDISLVGYTFEAKVEPSDGSTAVSMTVANTDLANGQITIGLTDTQITAIGAGTTNKWYLTWTISGASRRVLAGKFIVKDYP